MSTVRRQRRQRITECDKEGHWFTIRGNHNRRVRLPNGSKYFPKTLNVVLAKEEGTAPAGEQPIEWLLLTNWPITTVEELMQVVQGYAQRWRIEEFHRTWKSGACRVEDMQLRSVSAAEKWATILATVATRIERFGAKANEQISGGAVPTIKQVVQWIAEIGGYTGKSSEGPPGSVTLSRGLREVLLAARVIAAVAPSCD